MSLSSSLRRIPVIGGLDPSAYVVYVGFLLIFNTFETDLGLEVAEFRVTPPEAAL